ncbi:(2Fe-2S) ferredoxin domain-containing protein [Sphingomonas mali]|uniref:(2Fe-2S) ferredoxin domain-containing protein n=1 Tax=Sphingomonas mali TaxID=40682 RepID=UPI000A98522D|nr:(2Fe-2S) ferredoxin domain-containing protein [Sphingomonas mali]
MASDELITQELGALGRGLESRWAGAILVCSKCSKKLDGGFGRKGRTSLGKALRKRFGLKKGRKSPVGLIEVKCLGVCPKGAVTLIDTRRPGTWRLVPAGADIEAIGRDLGLDPGVQAPSRRAITSR